MKKIKTGVFQRSFALAKLSLKSGTLAAKQYMSSNADKEEYIIEQVKMLTKELGELKGSLMKVGQTISMYGEHFLPAKANEYLKNLQSDSPKLPWSQIKKFLEEEIGAEKLKNLDIDKTAIAAASLGQVHKAIDKKTGKELAIKIQYPGVEKAIKSDLKAFRSILSVAQIMPNGPRTNQLFEEIETMLIQETNYDLEKVWTQLMARKLKGDTRFVVPEVYEEYSSRHVLTTSFEAGDKVDSDVVQKLSQDRRNTLALNFLDLYYKELFDFKIVQTDPHLGNYRVRVNDNGQDQLVLYDFGAMREVPDHFGKPFKNLVRAAADRDRDGILKAGRELKYVMDGDSEELQDKYYEMCCLIGEAFAEDPNRPFTDEDGNYDWRKTDLPKRVAVIGREIVMNYKLRIPPREAIFLDRKLGGVFIFASVMGLKGKARSGLMRYM